MQSQEKIDLLKMLGADVRPVPAVAYENPKNYNHQAKEFAEATPGAVWTNQFDNVANARAHYETTGPEIWRQTGGKVGQLCSTPRALIDFGVIRLTPLSVPLARVVPSRVLLIISGTCMQRGRSRWSHGSQTHPVACFTVT